MKATIRKRATKFRTFNTMIILLLVAGVGVPACAPAPKPTELLLGALVCRTGELSSSGESSEAALEIAVKDINGYLSSIGGKASVRLIAEDTETDPAVALEKLKGLAQKGTRVIIGPQSSAEVEAVKAYADKNGLLLISQSSTTTSLAIPGDNVFRFCPDDTLQAEATARLMWEDGMKAVVPIWRDDVWGVSLSTATKRSFEELGGNVLDGIRYDPTTDDFSAQLESLSLEVSQAIAQYGADAVGVHLMAFEEVVPLFVQAGQEQHAILSTVKWYGSDGTARSNALVNNTQAARFAVRTGFPNPIYRGKTEVERYGLIEAQIQEKIGRPPTAYDVAAYDALWVVTQAYLATGETDDIEALKKAVLHTAGSYVGATGRTSLNEAGDRQFQDYGFWAVGENVDEEAFQWVCVARYRRGASEGRLTYETKPFQPDDVLSNP